MFFQMNENTLKWNLKQAPLQCNKKSFVPVHFASQHPRSSEMTRIIMLLEKHLSAIFQHTGDIENKLATKSTRDNSEAYKLTTAL